MTWPPRVGEPLPRAAEAIGVRDKLLGYSLDPMHKNGGPKARGFKRILGITADEVAYLEAALRRAILTIPVKAVRTESSYGIQCEVRIPVCGVGDKRSRTVDLITGWELVGRDAPPRMTTAYLKP